MMAVNNTNRTMGDRNRKGSTSAATDSLAAGNTDQVDGANTPKRQATPRSPRKTPHSQTRKKKSQRITAGIDNISVDTPSINADIMQGNTDFSQSGDLDGGGSMNLPGTMEVSDNVAVNIDCDANNAALPQRNNTEIATSTEAEGNSALTSTNEVSNEHPALSQILNMGPTNPPPVARGGFDFNEYEVVEQAAGSSSEKEAGE